MRTLGDTPSNYSTGTRFRANPLSHSGATFGEQKTLVAPQLLQLQLGPHLQTTPRSIGTSSKVSHTCRCTVVDMFGQSIQDVQEVLYRYISKTILVLLGPSGNEHDCCSRIF